MKRVRFAEEEAVASMDDDDGDDDVGIAAPAATTSNPGDPAGDDSAYSDIRSAEEKGPPAPPPSRRRGDKNAIPLEPFNMAAERRDGLVDARGNLVPFDERRRGGPLSAARGAGSSRARREAEGDAWVEGLEEELEEEDEDIAGEMEGVPAFRNEKKKKKSGRGGSSSSSDDSDRSDDESESDDDGMTNRPLAEAAPLSGAELRALKLRLARLLKPEETVLAALRRLATPAGIAGSPASTGGGLLLSGAAASAAAAAADAAAAALSSSPMLRDSIVVERGGASAAGGGAGAAGVGTVSRSGARPLLPAHTRLPPLPQHRRRGRTVPASNLPAFEEVTDLAAALAAAGEARAHWLPREALLDGAGVVSPVSPAAVSGRKRRTEGGRGAGEEEGGGGEDNAASASRAAVAAAAAAAAAEINAPGLVINGVQTDYKLVTSEGEKAQHQGGGGGGGGGNGPLYYSSSRGLFLSVPEGASTAPASASAPAAPAALTAASISSPPRVRCAATGAWKRARPVTDDGGKSGS